jgi:hypothetical protein
MSDSIAKHAVEDFKIFIQNDGDVIAASLLQDYLAHWVGSGSAIIATGSFDAYLRAVVLIVDEWRRDPKAILGEYQVSAAFDPDADSYDMCMRPDNYNILRLDIQRGVIKPD